MSTLEELLASLAPQEQQALLARLGGAEADPPRGDVGQDDLLDPIPRRAAEQAPLSFAQRGLWFLHQLRPEDTAYHICYAIDWPEPVDVAALSAALDDLTGRHEVLRTIFPSIDGEPRQVILPSLPVPLTEVGLAGDDDAGARKWTESATAQPFDLERGPLLRATLMRSGARCTLVLAIHHIIFDARSMEVLLDELTACYDQRAAGQPPALRPLPVQYADFAAWQHERLAGHALDENKAYWRARLAGAQALQLPADHLRPAATRSSGAAHQFEIRPSLRADLVALGRQHDATLFMVLLAGFVALLHRYTGDEDIAVGSSITSRDRPEIEGLIGYFLNTLVLRTDVDGELSFGGLITRVRRTVLEAFEHCDMPFEQLVEDLAPERAMGTLPLVPVLFAFSRGSAGTASGRPDDRPTRPVVRGLDSRGARADLTLAVQDGQDRLRGAIEYNLGMFDPDTITRMCGRLLRLLEAGAARPHTPVAVLPIMADRESAELASWNSTSAPAAPMTSVTQLITERAQRTPAKTAMREGTTAISYAEFEKRSDRIARWLRGAGVQDGRPVGVLLPRSADQVIVLAGVLKAGGAYLPLDPAYPAERLAFMRSDAGADVVISRSGLTSLLAGPRGGDSCPLLLLDQPWEPSETAQIPSVIPVHPDQPAYIFYTSGSTGRPKGVVNTHRGLINHMAWMLERFRPGPQDVAMYKTPMSFDVSLWELLLPPMAGCELIVARPDGHKDPAYLTDLIERHGVTLIHFVPSMLQAFLATADAARCGSLRQVMCTGEPLTAETRTRFYAAGFTAGLDNLYGPTEAAIHVTCWACDPAETGEVPIGHPFRNVQAYVLDARGEQLPVGLPGELYLGGDNVALGYVGRYAMTAASFVPDPFHPEPGRRLYRTGDVARRRSDGALEFLGRTDDQVKLRGNRIELGEIEVALTAHGAVAEAVVLLATSPAGDASLLAYLVPEGPAPANAELREHLRRFLPAYMIPASYAIIDAIPLTPNGKADKKALHAISPDAARGREYVGPRDGIEATVAGLFAALVGIERVGVHDDFFELGGHSLLALRLRARVHRDFDVDLPLGEIFEDPTVEGVAGKITSQIRQWAQAVETGQILRPHG